ncbi:MAG: hypothetical protein KDJ31_12540 [Candidatus Competibacteraceae bacterium]|nr:hypothetical protein [Candidatus Competibacteraceae bacterium]
MTWKDNTVAVPPIRFFDTFGEDFSLRNFANCFGWGLMLFILSATTPASEPSTGQPPLDRPSPASTTTSSILQCPPATTEIPSNRNPGATTASLPSLPNALQPGNQRPQTDCYLSPQEAAAQFRNHTAYLIDVRASAAFEQYHISGALNIPAYAIKTKPFLKNKPLILIDAGYRSHTLDTLCQTLRQQNYTVAILDGGLNAWRHQVAPLTGDALAQVNLDSAPSSPLPHFASASSKSPPNVKIPSAPRPTCCSSTPTATTTESKPCCATTTLFPTFTTSRTAYMATTGLSKIWPPCTSAFHRRPRTDSAPRPPSNRHFHVRTPTRLARHGLCRPPAPKRRYPSPAPRASPVHGTPAIAHRHWILAQRPDAKLRTTELPHPAHSALQLHGDQHHPAFIETNGNLD